METTKPLRPNAACRCQQPSTVDSEKNQTQWYKDMYCKIHKIPENKKDIILVKLPPTVSRYREYYQQQDEQPNPYKPTYMFPEEFDGNLKQMEDYMRNAASQNIDDDRTMSLSPVKTSTTTTIIDCKTLPKRNTEKITHFDDQIPSSKLIAFPTDQVQSNNDASTSSLMVSSRPNTTYNRLSSSTTDDEQRSIYKRILKGGEIPSVGLQKISSNNREASNTLELKH